MKKRTKANSQVGFSLLELMIVLALLGIIMGSIFAQINQAQQNSTSQQIKLDLFQESREFMDQIARDLRASGYPNTRNFSSDPVSPAEQSPQEAVGLVKLDVGELWFESSIDGSGNVSVIHYDLVQTGTGCPCLERSQTPKIQADPLTGQTETDQVDVQSVINGTSADPIFKAYYADGTTVSLPIDITNNALANVNTVDIILKVQSPNRDPQTGQQATMTLMTTVRLNNCSVAYPNTTGTVMGCK
ncbi:MAG: prepilin-type N-terminal cleavage/methylation domain-containing protein [Terriglobia bacterium]|jgi:prepilin-type N-terminal cleavage/methylation domain-containing protein